MVAPRTRRPCRFAGEAGFTLAELLIAMLISVASLGAATVLTDQISRGFTSQLDDALVQEEARFALRRIERELRSAGNNPYGIVNAACPAAGTPFQAVQIDPKGAAVMDDIRIHADVNPPNGQLGGAPCGSDQDEDVTIAHDAVTQTVTRLDNNVVGGQPVQITDGVISQLRFRYLDAARVVTANPANVAFVQIAVTSQAPNYDRARGQAPTYTLTSDVRIRLR